MENKKENKNSLGFLFSFKESQQIDNKISVYFKSGFSKKIPNKYKNKKDFESCEIFEGDTSDLFININEYVQLFDKELNKEILAHKEYYQELYNNKKYSYQPTINEEQYFVLTAFNYARLNYMFIDFQNNEEKTEVLKLTIGKVFDKKLDLLEIHTNFTEVNHQIYLNEIDNAFGNTTNKKLKL